MHVKLTVSAAAAVAVVAAGVAWATIPAGDGRIDACYDDRTGQVRVYDAAGGSIKDCGKNETGIFWSQTGPPGPAGPQGPAGTFSGAFESDNGDYGVSVTDAGIELTGPTSSIVLDGDGVTIGGSSPVSIESSGAISLDGAVLVSYYPASPATEFIGECKPGVMNLKTGEIVEAPTVPIPEVPGDGLDNDCDGVTDEP